MDLRGSGATSVGSEPIGLLRVVLPRRCILYYLLLDASGCQTQGVKGKADGRTRVKGIKSVVAVLALGAFAPVPGAFAQNKGTIGVSMPTKSAARWIDDGDNVQSASGRAVKTWRA